MVMERMHHIREVKLWDFKKNQKINKLTQIKLEKREKTRRIKKEKQEQKRLDRINKKIRLQQERKRKQQGSFSHSFWGSFT